MTAGGSSTARTVLQGVWLTACDPATRHLVPPDMAEAARAAMVRIAGERRTRRFGSPLFRSALRLAQRVMLPGIATHYVARKNAIHATVLSEAVEQLVVLGGGFDGLAWRVAGERPTVRCVEIDHPATQAMKRKVLADLPDRGVELIACDLADADAAVRAVSALPSRPTVFVAEGLLMYLPPTAVRNLLSTIVARGDPAVFSFMMPDRRGRPTFDSRQFLLRQYLRWVGEPFRWALRPDSAVDFCAGLGFRLDRLHGVTWPATDVRIETGMIAGEWLAVVTTNRRTGR